MPLYGNYPAQRIADGPHDVAPSNPDAGRFLRDARIGDGFLHPYASNYTFVVELELGGKSGFGVYKPRLGEAPLRDFPDGTLFRRELAAYELSVALGWGLIPPTVERDGEGGEGSLQLYVPHEPDSHFFSLRDEREDECLRLAVFDVIANNADRKGGHCFLGPDDRLWAVDNGLTFHADPKLRTVIWDYAGRRAPDALLADAARVAAGLPAALHALLATEETDALAARIRAFLADPELPSPRSRRDIPWPLL